MSTAAHSPRIHMVGFYGHANFGDDVLMQVTYRLLKQAAPNAKISVAAGPHGNYIPTILGDIEPQAHALDLIVHGGGGVFFDFKHYGPLQRLFESLIRFFGWRLFLTTEKIARTMMGKSHTNAKRRIGLGIGVGTFTPGSPRLRDKLPIFADFTALWLRDGESFSNLKPFESVLKAELIAGSDLAFLTEYWLPERSPRVPSSRPRLGIVLRDWPESQGGMAPATLQATLHQLAKSYEITAFIFDEHADPQLQSSASAYPTHIWRPHSMHISDFAEKLAAQDVLLTSRAHGAICGACVGVPSVIVPIEPKLAQVHAMLPSSTIVAANPTEWPEALAAALTISPTTIAADVMSNRTRSLAAWQNIKRWVA